MWFQIWGVEVDSFLPNGQRNRSDLARQRQARHLRLDPLGDQRIVKLLERTSLDSGDGRGTLEQIFEIVIVIQPRIEICFFELSSNPVQPRGLNQPDVCPVSCSRDPHHRHMQRAAVESTKKK